MSCSARLVCSGSALPVSVSQTCSSPQPSTTSVLNSPAVRVSSACRISCQRKVLRSEVFQAGAGSTIGRELRIVPRSAISATAAIALSQDPDRVVVKPIAYPRTEIATESTAAVQPETSTAIHSLQAGPSTTNTSTQLIDSKPLSKRLSRNPKPVSTPSATSVLQRGLELGYKSYKLDPELEGWIAWNSVAECNSCLRVLCQKAPWPKVWQAYQALEANHVLVEQPTFQLLIVAAVQAGFAQDAVDLFHRLQEVHALPDQKHYCSLISKLLKLHTRGVPSSRLAYQLWMELLDSGLSLDAASYRTGIDACVENGRIREATKLLQRTMQLGIKVGSGAFNRILKYHAKRGDMDTARKLFRTMKQQRVSVSIVTYNTLLSGFVRAGDTVMAQAVFDKAVREGVVPDVRLYTQLMQVLVKTGQVQLAEELLAKMRAAHVQPSLHTYAVLLKGHLTANDFAAVDRTVQQARALDPKLSLPVYNTLITGYCRKSRLDVALKLLQELQAVGLQPSSTTYSVLLDAAVNNQDVGLAMDLLAQLRDSGVVQDAVIYTTLAQLFKLSGQKDSAIQLFQQLSRTSHGTLDVIALCAAADVCAKAGNMQEAEDMVQQAVQTSQQLGLKPPAAGLMSLVNGYGRRGQVKSVLHCFRRFLVAGGTPTPKMCNKIVRVCLRSGDLQLASKVVRAIEMTGVAVDVEEYRRWFQETAKQIRERNGRGGQDDLAVERLKWFFGLPNSYYNSEWK